jgi:Flp pilus assembly protein TadG
MLLKPRLPKLRMRGESGMSSIEVVLLAPLVIGFIMVLVCFGVLVDARGTVEGAAADAARAGSLQNDPDTALADAKAAAQADLGTSPGATCTGGWVLTEINPNTGLATRNPPFEPGDNYIVRITCTVSLSGLNWFNLGKQSIAIESASPLDTYRTTD